MPALTNGNPIPRRERAVAPVKFHLVAAAVVVAWVIFQLGERTSQVFTGWRFILYDQGSYLYAVGCWQAGETLYRDFAWQYGPLALGWYRAFAAIGGNSPLTLVLASSAAFAVAWVLITRLAVGAGGWVWGGGLALIGLLPVMSQSGPLAINGPHGAVEMLLLALCAWVLAGTMKESQRAYTLGLLAGLLQWVRFGPHAVTLAAILVMVAVDGWMHRADNRSFFRKLWGFAWRLAAGYGAALLPLAAWYFRALPAAGAWEQLWPAYMIDVYAETFPNRWPHLALDRGFFLDWLPAMAGVGLALGWLGSCLRRRSDVAPPLVGHAVAGLVFLPLYYALACMVLFHNDYAIIGHLWLAWPGLALGLRLVRGWGRALLAALALLVTTGAALTTWTGWEQEHRSAARPLVLPNGQQLWFRPREAAEFAQWQAGLAAIGSSAPRLTVFRSNGGIHYFFRTQRVGRVWYFVPGMVRPWDEAAVWEALLHSERILVADMGAAPLHQTPGVVSLLLPLPRPMAERLLPHLSNLRYFEGVGYLVDVKP